MGYEDEQFRKHLKKHDEKFNAEAEKAGKQAFIEKLGKKGEVKKDPKTGEIIYDGPAEDSAQ
jgi:hypothetical protein